jgi:hypothetical protein
VDVSGLGDAGDEHEGKNGDEAKRGSQHDVDPGTR